MADARNTTAWYWFPSVDVMAPAGAAAIVAYGDSITDGTTSTVNANKSWPTLLSERLVANKATADLSVLNLGISGNRVLGDGAGVSALARFDRDVLAQPGVKWLMILEGINDMNGAARGGGAGGPAITADDLIAGMKQMIDRAHTHGIKVIGCTLTPYGNATDVVEAMRQALNKFIRTPGNFDAMVAFDKVIQDPADPRQSSKRDTITPINCIRTMRVIRPWRTPWTFRYSPERRPRNEACNPLVDGDCCVRAAGSESRRGSDG